MKINKTQKLILYSLGQFYKSINQPLIKKPIKLKTSKIIFIELLIDSGLISKQKRALYKNLEDIEKKKLIEYENKMIKFTENGIKELKIIDYEINKYFKIAKYFFIVDKPNRKLQTIIG